MARTNLDTAFNLEAKRLPKLVKAFIAFAIADVMVALASLAIL